MKASERNVRTIKLTGTLVRGNVPVDCGGTVESRGGLFSERVDVCRENREIKPDLVVFTKPGAII